MSLWATPAARERLAGAAAAVLIVGSYDGSGNFGDVLQLEGALEVVRSMEDAPLAVPVAELQCTGHHEALGRRFPDLFAGACFVFYADGSEAPAPGLVELTGADAPAGSFLYLSGGGYLNGMWGARKMALAGAAEAFAAGTATGPPPPLPVACSGLQVDPETIVAGGLARPLLRRSHHIGLRDARSYEAARAELAPAGEADVHLDGDDATLLLAGDPGEAPAGPPVVNLHLSDEPYVTGDPGRLFALASDAMRALQEAAGGALEVQLAYAYEEPRISERAVLERFAAEHSAGLPAHLASAIRFTPLDVLDDALSGSLARFRRARLTIACSYHVALTSLLSAIPIVHLAENAYYRHKAAGLRDLFDLPPELLRQVQDGTGEEVAAVAWPVVADGPAREHLVAHLRRGRDAAVLRRREAAERLRLTLGAPPAEARAARDRGLARALPELERERAAQAEAHRRELADAHARLAEAEERAHAAEVALARVTGTRAWRAITRFWRLRTALANLRRPTPRG